MLNVSTCGTDSPPPEGVMVIVPVYSPFGVTVNTPDCVPIAPPVGPLKVNPVAGAIGVNELEPPEEIPVPTALTARTEHV